MWHFLELTDVGRPLDFAADGAGEPAVQRSGGVRRPAPSVLKLRILSFGLSGRVDFTSFCPRIILLARDLQNDGRAE